MDSALKEQLLWAVVIVAIAVPMTVFGGMCGLRSCNNEREQRAQSAALKMECVKTGRTPAECDALR